MKNTIRAISILLVLPFGLAGQIHLSGNVLDNGEGVPGATIQIKNTDRGAITDADGFFEFKNLEAGSYELEIRSIGFKTKFEHITLSQGSAKSLDVSLEESFLAMDEVVVIGTMSPTFVSQSPVKIDVVTSDYLNTFRPAAATGIVEGISLINGVQEVVACGVCFTNSISINGLPGPYTAVLMDGAPIYGNLASVYGLNGIPSMIIDRFEVIKGPSSTLYGSEAVAGVINIITKDPSSQPIFGADVMGTSQQETFGNFSFAPKIGKSTAFIGLNYAYINGFDDKNQDGFNDNINLDRFSLFTKWNLHRPSGKAFTLTGKYYYEDRRNGVQEFLENKNYRTLRGDEEIYGESIYTNRAELFGSYEFLPSLKLDYSGSIHRQNSFYGSDFYSASQDIVFANLVWQEQLRKHNLTGGITSRYQSYDDNTIATEQNGDNLPDNQYIPGIFLQDEYEVSKDFTTHAGARLDRYKDHGLIFAPRLSLKYKLGSWTTLRGNFGTGFRIVNLFTEDHAFVTGQREVIVSETLNPEESFNYSTNLNHVYTLGESQGMIDIDAFYTYFTNKITPDYSDANSIIYANTDGFAISRGVGLNIQHEFSFPFALNVGYNLQEVKETENGEERRIEFAPIWSGVVTMNYQLKSLDIAVSYSANFTGPMALPEVFDLDQNGNPTTESRPTTSDAFAIHNLQFTKSTKKQGLSFYAGIQNLFNFVQPWSPLVGFNDPNSRSGFSSNFDTSYAYAPIHGREVYLGIRWNVARN